MQQESPPAQTGHKYAKTIQYHKVGKICHIFSIFAGVF